MTQGQGGSGTWGPHDQGEVAAAPPGDGPPSTHGAAGPPSPQGAPAPPGYGPPPGYRAAGPPAGHGYPPPGAVSLPPGVSYASWGSRALALLIDALLMLACVAPAIAVTGVTASRAAPGEGPSTPVGIALVVLFVGGIGLWLFNIGWRQGARGQSWGKTVVGIHLVRESDLRPPGGGLGIGRYLLRSALGNATCGVYSLITGLWPLWDERSQSLDDKMLHTLVVRLPR